MQKVQNCSQMARPTKSPIKWWQPFVMAILLNCASTAACAQNLAGTWQGDFEDSARRIWPILLEFILKEDSSYTVYSYSKAIKADGSDTVAVCEVLYERPTKNSFYLQEVTRLLPKDPTPSCLQVMYLKLHIGQKKLRLSGTWKSAPNNYGCTDKGNISFWKKRTD